jgi:cytochrome c5
VSKVNTHFGTSIGTAIVVGVLVVVINNVVGSALKGPSTADMSDEAIAERIKPVAQLNTGAPIVPEAPAAEAAPAAAAGATRSGKEVYDSACFACHGTGAAGAPKMGDAAAWAPRIDKGLDTLMDHAVNGFNAMPPRGTCGNCSDDELKAAIEYMIENSK